MVVGSPLVAIVNGGIRYILVTLKLSVVFAANLRTVFWWFLLASFIFFRISIIIIDICFTMFIILILLSIYFFHVLSWSGALNSTTGDPGFDDKSRRAKNAVASFEPQCRKATFKAEQGPEPRALGSWKNMRKLWENHGKLWKTMGKWGFPEIEVPP